LKVYRPFTESPSTAGAVIDNDEADAVVSDRPRQDKNIKARETKTANVLSWSRRLIYVPIGAF